MLALLLGGVNDDFVGLFLESLCLGFDWHSCTGRFDELVHVGLLWV
jgi:hypothetical protein